MSERVSWIEQGGKKILFIDYSNITTIEELRTVIERVEALSFPEPDQSILRLTHIAGSSFTEEARQLLKAHADRIKVKTKASAAVGFTGLKAIIARAINPRLKLLNTLDEAKAWLVTQ